MEDDANDALHGVPADRGPETKCEMVRVPPEIWPALESSLKAQGNFAAAWLQEVCRAFPGRSLLEMQQSKPRLFPSLLQTFERTECIQDHLVLQSDGDISVRAQPEDHRREGLRETQLAAFRACRFRQGFASAGMLCNEPPIPLRVLDFLEAQDLIRLSLVCKSTHQAAHLLFKREEAMAFCVQSISVPCSTAHPHPRSWAQVLRGIRIGSLMHGTPEVIPFRQGTPRLLRFNPGNDACHETLAWSWRGWRSYPTSWQRYLEYFCAREFKDYGSGYPYFYAERAMRPVVLRRMGVGFGVGMELCRVNVPDDCCLINFCRACSGFDRMSCTTDKRIRRIRVFGL